ncbi:hypothetical protein QAD02_009971 [Eretmocerus hayati]|uniref:Uncharacterized protein n=1 Tax=Eretmocerus hayati TaxID=131215 RepID=A0ACC2NBJ3_9HYME|nr:hypothetical protein QAD02_009971 [Eretmocerus hayati]
MPSSVVTLQPHAANALDLTMSSGDLADLDDAINDSLQGPPTPATPEHLRNRQPACGSTTELRAEMLSPTTNSPRSSIRVRIRRIPFNDHAASTDHHDVDM